MNILHSFSRFQLSVFYINQKYKVWTRKYTILLTLSITVVTSSFLLVSNQTNTQIIEWSVVVLGCSCSTYCPPPRPTTTKLPQGSFNLIIRSQTNTHFADVQFNFSFPQNFWYHLLTGLCSHLLLDTRVTENVCETANFECIHIYWFRTYYRM